MRVRIVSTLLATQVSLTGSVFFAVEALDRQDDTSFNALFHHIAFTVNGAQDLKWCSKDSFQNSKGLEVNFGEFKGTWTRYGALCHIEWIDLHVLSLAANVD